MSKMKPREDIIIPKGLPIFVHQGKYKPLPRSCKNCNPL